MSMLLSERNQFEKSASYMSPTTYDILGKEKLETKN